MPYTVPTPDPYKQPFQISDTRGLSKIDRFYKKEPGTTTEPTFGELAGHLIRARGQAIQPLLDRQYQETEAAKDAYYKSRQEGVNALSNRSSLIDEEINRVRNNPNTSFLRRHIQSIIDNPEVYSQQDIARQQNINRNESMKLLDSLIASEQDSAAARGLSGSGITGDRIAQLTADTASNISNQGFNIAYQAAQARAQNLLDAIGAGINLEDLDSQTINYLMGLATSNDQAIADIISGTDYSGPDYTGLISLGVSDHARKQAEGRSKTGIADIIGTIAPAAGSALGGYLGNLRL